MRKILVGLVSIGLLFGCSAGPTDEDKRTEAFLNAMREEYPGLKDAPDEQLIDAGKGICEFLEDGMTLDGIIVTARNAGVQEELMGSFAGAGIPAFCPERQGQLYEWIHG